MCRIVAAGSDELVHVLESLVIAGVNNDTAVSSQNGRGTFVFNASESRALFWHCRWIVRVDLDDPAETKWLVWFRSHIEAVVVKLPTSLAVTGCSAVTCVNALARITIGKTASVCEILIEVFFTGKHGSPGCLSAGAIVESSTNDGTGRIV